MRMRGVIVGCVMVCLVLPEKTAAQAPVADTLQEVGVRGERKPTATDARAYVFSPGLKSTVLDSLVLRLYTQQTVATLLSEQSSVFVKSYGFNSLATLNFRGASAAQSLVLWNGVPLQNAALGLADVSLLPVSLLDKVSVLYGASAGLWGSGAVGGAVLLESDSARFEKAYRRLDASASYGSFGQRGGLVRGDVSGNRFGFSIRAFAQQAENDFWTPATLFHPAEKQRNASIRAGGILIRGAAKLSPRETLEAHAWAQRYDRQIPRALSESSSVKAQSDRSLRGLLHYRRVGRVEINAKVAGFADELGYEDAASLLHSTNRSQQLFSEVSARFGRKDAAADFLLFAPVQVSWMRRADDSQVWQRRAAIAGAARVRLMRSRLESAATLRAEEIDGRRVFLPGINALFQALPWLSVRTSFQHTYRAPTLSERYYFPGGNPSLKPEEGWGGEAGYTLYRVSRRGWTFKHEGSVYHRDIRNWILWFGGVVWTPHNIAAVHSQGVELDNRLAFPLSRGCRFILTANAALSRATTRMSDMLNDGSIGKQLPYTPKTSGNASVGIYFKQIFVSYQHLYTGLRYITTDESFSLPSYHAGNVNVMWEGRLAHHTAALSVRAANIWDEEYAVVAGRPMPGRHFLATARFGFL